MLCPITLQDKAPWDDYVQFLLVLFLFFFLPPSINRKGKFVILGAMKAEWPKAFLLKLYIQVHFWAKQIKLT